MKIYIKPITDTSSAYVEVSIMVDSTNTIPVIIGNDVPVLTDGEEILSPKFNLWEVEEEEQ